MRMTVSGLIFLTVMASCVTDVAIREREKVLIEKWRAENPDKKPSKEEAQEIRKQAKKDVKEEAKKDQQKAIKTGSSAASSFIRGDLIGGGLSLLALIGLGVGAYRKARGKGVKKNG